MCWKTSSLKVDTHSLQNHSVVSLFQFHVIQRFKNDTGWRSTATIKRKEARQRNKEKKERNRKGKNIHRTLFETETQTVHCTRRKGHFGAVIHFLFSKNFFVIIRSHTVYIEIHWIAFVVFRWQFRHCCCCFNCYDFIQLFFCSVQVLVRKRPTHQMFPTKFLCLIKNWWFLCVIQRQIVIYVLSRVWFDEWCACFEPQFFKNGLNVLKKIGNSLTNVGIQICVQMLSPNSANGQWLEVSESLQFSIDIDAKTRLGNYLKRFH